MLKIDIPQLAPEDTFTKLFMYKKIIIISTILLISKFCIAQQNIGLNTSNISIQHMPVNPAWVTQAKSGTEFNLVSANAMAGTNAYKFTRGYLFGGFANTAVETVDYDKNIRKGKKHLWGNFELLGPSFSYTYKKEHHLGVFTRMRQITRAGNVNNTSFILIGNESPEKYYNEDFGFKKAGFTTHTFAEVGFTYGRELYNNEYHIFNGGISLKYLMGFAAASIYANNITYNQKGEDTVGLIEGDLSMQYTYNSDPFLDDNFGNDISSWFTRGGKWGIGLDIGVQYEYHPDGNPNKETPYLFSIAASITDIGGINYVADTGSGDYQIKTANFLQTDLQLQKGEGINNYLLRLVTDSLAQNPDYKEKFSVGLPTAFRLNTDWNIMSNFNISVNLLLNLRGNNKNQGVYKPAYVNYINFTPRYGSKSFNISMPFTYIGYQTMAIGVAFNAGPFYIGSSSLVSSFITSRVSYADVYMGLVYKFKKKQNRY